MQKQWQCLFVKPALLRSQSRKELATYNIDVMYVRDKVLIAHTTLASVL